MPPVPCPKRTEESWGPKVIREEWTYGKYEILLVGRRGSTYELAVVGRESTFTSVQGGVIASWTGNCGIVRVPFDGSADPKKYVRKKILFAET